MNANPPHLQGLADELNQLLASETRSLARHLDEAKPYLTPKTFLAWQDIQRMSQASREHSQRLSGIFERLELSPRPVGFPSEVANYHFLTLGSLVPLLIRQKHSQIEAYQRAIDHAGRAGGAGGAGGGSPVIVDELAALLADNRAQLARLEAFTASSEGASSTVAGRN